MTRRWPAALIAGGGLAVLTLGVASGQAPAPAGTVVPALLRDFVPVTDEMLLRPEPENWISFCNGYNLWGYSSLDEIDAGNVGEMRLVWSRAMQHGYQEVEPIVYNGVMFLPNVEDIVQALDATTGDLLWEYRRALPDNVANVTGTRYRYRNVSIYVDKVFLATNDAFLVALDVRTGEVVWEMQRADYSEQVAQTTGPLVIGGKLVTGSRCNPQSPRPGGCFVTGHDLETGRELWRVNTAATSTGKTLWSHQQRAPIYGSVLATGGDLVFGGDVVRRFRAFGAETGDVLWRTILNGPVGGRPKTYSVGGRQHIAIAPAGLAIGSAFLGLTPELTTPSGSNTLFVFALPERPQRRVRSSGLLPQAARSGCVAPVRRKQVPAVLPRRLPDLCGQLAARRDHERARVAGRLTVGQALQDRLEEGRGLARAAHGANELSARAEFHKNYASFRSCPLSSRADRRPYQPTRAAENPGVREAGVGAGQHPLL